MKNYLEHYVIVDVIKIRRKGAVTSVEWRRFAR